jgi:hypothetical protein
MSQIYRAGELPGPASLPGTSWTDVTRRCVPTQVKLATDLRRGQAHLADSAETIAAAHVPAHGEQIRDQCPVAWVEQVRPVQLQHSADSGARQPNGSLDRDIVAIHCRGHHQIVGIDRSAPRLAHPGPAQLHVSGHSRPVQSEPVQA